MYYMGLCTCIQFAQFSHDDCENMCTWSYYHNQIGRMTHLPLFRVRSWNNGIRCMSLNILIFIHNRHWVWVQYIYRQLEILMKYTWICVKERCHLTTIHVLCILTFKAYSLTVSYISHKIDTTIIITITLNGRNRKTYCHALAAG